MEAGLHHAPQLGELFLEWVMGIGIIGILCNTGVGMLIEDHKRHLPIDSHFVIPHRLYGRVQRLVNSSPCPVQDSDLEGWVSKRKAILYMEHPHHGSLPALCLRHRVKQICVVDIDWFNPREGWVAKVDLFVAPNRYTLMTLLSYGIKRAVYIPACIDTDFFQYSQKDVCHEFLFCNGRGGYLGRKGLDIVIAACCSTGLPVITRSQQPITQFPGSMRVFTGDVADRRDLLRRGQVYLAPTRWEGYGLHILEAMACGYPVLVTSGNPMAEYVQDTAWHINVDHVSQRWGPGRFSGLAHEPDPESLAMLMRKVHGSSVKDASAKCRELIERVYSWKANADRWAEALRGLGL